MSNKAMKLINSHTGLMECRACVSIPIENSSFCRSKIPPPFGGKGLQFQPTGVNGTCCV